MEAIRFLLYFLLGFFFIAWIVGMLAAMVLIGTPA